MPSAEITDAALRPARLLRCEHEVEIVSGATHLFEESGGWSGSPI